MGLIVLLMVAAAACFINATEGCYFVQDVRPGETYYIQSPNFPDGIYEPGSSCTWAAVADEGSRVVLSCDEVQIPQSGASCLDYLVVSPTDDPGDGRSYCGTNSFVYVSPTSRLNLQLISRSWSSGGRFSCSVSSRTRDITPPGPSTSCDCGWSYRTRIVNGEETKINEFPFMAGLVSSRLLTLFCGVTIVSSRFLLTAAHCLRNNPPETLAVLVGEHNIRTGRETDATKLVGVQNYLIHPSYNDSSQANDIAIVQTKQDIPFSMRVGPICLPFRVTGDLVGRKVTALGWGTKDFGGSTSDTLQKVVLDAVPVTRCQAVYGAKIQPMTQICTYTRGKDACQFDSGGPLIYFNPQNNRYTLAGIISYGRGCADPDIPSVNTRVSSYLDWIARQTGADFCLK